jgi:hypothetical protein
MTDLNCNVTGVQAAIALRALVMAISLCGNSM